MTDDRGATTDGVTTAPGLLALTWEFAKATPKTEGDRRFVFCEASNETWDQEREKVAADALWASREHYLAKGNVDIDHQTVLHYRLGRRGDPREWEIGLPREVKRDGRHIFVKTEIYRNHKAAEDFWHNVTVVDPAMPYYPSVAGDIPADGYRAVFDPATKEHRKVITRVLWKNLAFSRDPVNQGVPGISTMPMGVFLKSAAWALAQPECCGDGCACTPAAKAITVAGHGTDVAGLSGGGALRLQSHPGKIIQLWAPRAAAYLKSLQAIDQAANPCAHLTGPITADTIAAHFRDCDGMTSADAEDAAAWLHARIAAQSSLRAAA